MPRSPINRNAAVGRRAAVSHAGFDTAPYAASAGVRLR